jgi:hypothetical protein
LYPSVLKELQSVGWSCTRHAGWSCSCVPLVWPTWRHCQCCTLLVCRTRSELRSRWATYTSKSVNFWMSSTKYKLINRYFLNGNEQYLRVINYSRLCASNVFHFSRKQNDETLGIYLSRLWQFWVFTLWNLFSIHTDIVTLK